MHARDPNRPQNNPEHKAQDHHHQLIDIGTFGGPSSYFNSLDLTEFGFSTVFYIIAQVRNGHGTFVGFADTFTPDPYSPFCYVPDCFVTHAFQWRNGVKTDLRALPGANSSAAFWINANGWIAGNSQNGETDPLPPRLGQRFGPFCGRRERSATLERSGAARALLRPLTTAAR